MILYEHIKCDICQSVFKEGKGLLLSVYISKNNKCPHGVLFKKPLEFFKLSQKDRRTIEEKYHIACIGTHYYVGERP
jgi:hypothetical protein